LGGTILHNFEEFLREQKEDFCKWFCEYNKLNIIQSDDIVGEQVFNKERNEIEVGSIILCEHCQLDNFIREIRDKPIKSKYDDERMPSNIEFKHINEQYGEALGREAGI